jgi:hypothetical protein
MSDPDSEWASSRAATSYANIARHFRSYPVLWRGRNEVGERFYEANDYRHYTGIGRINQDAHSAAASVVRTVYFAAESAIGGPIFFRGVRPIVRWLNGAHEVFRQRGLLPADPVLQHGGMLSTGMLPTFEESKNVPGPGNGPLWRQAVDAYRPRGNLNENRTRALLLDMCDEYGIAAKKAELQLQFDVPQLTPFARRFRVDSGTGEVWFDGQTILVSHPALVALLGRLAAAEGMLVPSVELRELPGCKNKRIDRIIRDHCPDALKDVIKSLKGNGGGYRLQLPPARKCA